MNLYERFESRDVAVESLNTPEAVALQEAITETISEYPELLEERHRDKVFHDPEHSLNEGGKEDRVSVVGRIKMLSRLLQESMLESLAAATPEDADTKTLFFEALADGATIHDAVIEFTVNDKGGIDRARGMAPGGNEYESFVEYKQKLIEKGIDVNEPLVANYLKTVEHVVHGTLADKAVFGYELPADMVTRYPENVQACLRGQNAEGNTTYKGFMLDSSQATESLPALLASTSDLGDVFVSEKFIASGNEEFIELNYGLVKDCSEYLNGAPIPRARAKQILNQMKGWRKTQVGVALCQKVRLEEKYTKDNLSSLCAKSFGSIPDPIEIENFLAEMESLISTIDETILDCADNYEEFVAQYDGLELEGEETLSAAETETFFSAITFMNGDMEQFERYVKHVEMNQKPRPEPLQMAA